MTAHSRSSNELDRKVTLSAISSDVEVATTNGTAEQMAFERRTMRRIDLRMLPLLGLLYALALIDRTNLGIARIAGMGEDLGLSVGNRYSVVSCVYFIPYILFELPSNIFLRFLGVRNFLAFLVVAWGATQLAMGFVPTWGYLTFCRALLGAFEAGFFPALVFIISTWYKRHEVQKRLAAFYVISILAGGFSAIFAYALSLLAGKGGLAGWSWIFVIEGAVTMFFGFVAWFYVPEFPDKNDFLTQEETALVLRRIEDDRGDSLPDSLSLKKVVHHLGDWKIWVFGVMFMCAAMPAYAIGFFITIILNSMGWNIAQSLLLSAPPYVFAAISVMVFAWLSDKFEKRAFFIAIQAIITIVGLLMTGYLTLGAWRYAGLFLSTAGSAGCVPGILAYASNNVVSHSKRAVSTAVTISFGGIGGVFATTIFRQQDFPRYVPGIVATISCQILLLVLLTITTVYFKLQNRRVREGSSAQMIEGSHGFLYTL